MKPNELDSLMSKNRNPDPKHSGVKGRLGIDDLIDMSRDNFDEWLDTVYEENSEVSDDSYGFLEYEAVGIHKSSGDIIINIFKVNIE